MKLRTLTVYAPCSFIRRLIAPSLPRFLHENPGLRVAVWEMNSLDERLAQEGDAAICTGPITSPDLVANKIGSLRSITCASPEFIEYTGAPESPWDLQSDHCMGVLATGMQRAQGWAFRRKSELHLIQPTAPLAFSDSDATIAAAVRGGGYARVLRTDAEQEIAAGLLGTVLNDWNDDWQQVALVCARRRSTHQDVRSFCAFLASILPSDECTLTSSWRSPAADSFARPMGTHP